MGDERRRWDARTPGVVTLPDGRRALAILARLSGVPAADAVAWVRERYDPRAVETPRQRRFVETVALPTVGSPDAGDA